MAKRGRKNKYYTHVEPNLMKILEMCKTMTEQQIAEQLGVGYSTFMEYKKQFPELTETLKKGRQNLVAELRSALIKKAKGYDYTETEVTRENGVITKRVEKHKSFGPDVAAINLLLKNYDKDNWANDPQTLELRKKELELRERQVEANEW